MQSKLFILQKSQVSEMEKELLQNRHDWSSLEESGSTEPTRYCLSAIGIGLLGMCTFTAIVVLSAITILVYKKRESSYLAEKFLEASFKRPPTIAKSKPVLF